MHVSINPNLDIQEYLTIHALIVATMALKDTYSEMPQLLFFSMIWVWMNL
jgi:hypothetical protein